MHGPAAQADDARHRLVTGEHQLVHAEEELTRHFDQRGGLFHVEPAAAQANLAARVVSLVAAGEGSGVTLEATLGTDTHALAERCTSAADGPVTVEEIIGATYATDDRQVCLIYRVHYTMKYEFSWCV